MINRPIFDICLPLAAAAAAAAAAGTSLLLIGVKSNQVVGLRDRVAIIRALLHAISSPHPWCGRLKTQNVCFIERR